MSLSEREQRILDEIERDLSAPASWPGRAAAGIRLALCGQAARYRHAARGNAGWVAAMIAGMLAGIGLLSAGLVCGVVLMVACGGLLTQLSPLSVAWLARWWRRVRLRRLLAADGEARQGSGR